MGTSREHCGLKISSFYQICSIPFCWCLCFEVVRPIGKMHGIVAVCRCFHDHSRYRSLLHKDILRRTGNHCWGLLCCHHRPLLSPWGMRNVRLPSLQGQRGRRELRHQHRKGPLCQLTIVLVLVIVSIRDMSQNLAYLSFLVKSCYAFLFRMVSGPEALLFEYYAYCIFCCWCTSSLAFVSSINEMCIKRMFCVCRELNCQWCV